jgi:RNA polymerase sigma-70 factor (ECF subfamily)
MESHAMSGVAVPSNRPKAAVCAERRLYAKLVERHYASVYNYLCWLARDETLAADLTAETFARVWRYLPRPREGSSLRAYVFRAALNEYHRHRGREAAAPAPIEEAEQAAAAAADEPPFALERHELRRCVRAALERLPETQRAVVLLHSLEGFTLCEVAEALEVPLGTAKSRLGAAFTTLRRLLHDWKEHPGELR